MAGPKEYDQPARADEADLDEQPRRGRLMLLTYICIFQILLAAVEPIHFLMSGAGLATQLIRLTISIAAFYFLYRGSSVAKWINVVLFGLGVLVNLFLGYKQRDPLALALFWGLAALYASFAWMILWSVRVKDFLELQSGKSWREAGGMITFLVLGVVSLASIVLPRFFADGSGPWVYHFFRHDIEITLPSKDWVEGRIKGWDVAFLNGKHTANVGVSVLPGREDDYQKRVQETQAYFDRISGEFLSELKYTEGVADSGNPYSCWTVTVKTRQGGAAFLARSLVWCKRKEVLVSVLLEGPLVMTSKLGKGAEQEFFLRSANTITSSIE